MRTVKKAILAFLAVLIKVDSPGPVFYRQERMGLDGKAFQVTNVVGGALEPAVSPDGTQIVRAALYYVLVLGAPRHDGGAAGIRRVVGAARHRAIQHRLGADRGPLRDVGGVGDGQVAGDREVASRRLHRGAREEAAERHGDGLASRRAAGEVDAGDPSAGRLRVAFALAGRGGERQYPGRLRRRPTVLRHPRWVIDSVDGDPVYNSSAAPRMAVMGVFSSWLIARPA